MDTQKLSWQNRSTRGSRVGGTAMLALALWLVSVSSGWAQDLEWAKRAGGTDSFDQGRGIAVDSSGNSYVMGIFSGTATFGPGEANQPMLTAAGTEDIFVAKYAGAVCGNLTPNLNPIGLRFPLTLAPLKKVTVRFQVLFTPDCMPDPARSTAAVGHQDYRVNATLDHNAFDGRLDTDPVDDICPHSVTPPFRADPNPDGTLQDKGCGKKQVDKTFGAPLLIDVVDKRGFGF